MWNSTVSRYIARFLIVVSVILLPLYSGAQGHDAELTTSNACRVNQGAVQVFSDSCHEDQESLPSVFNLAPQTLEFTRCAEGIQAACIALLNQKSTAETKTFTTDPTSANPRRLRGTHATMPSSPPSSADTLRRESRVNPSGLKP